MKKMRIYSKRRNALFMRTVYWVCEDRLFSAMPLFAVGGVISVSGFCNLTSLGLIP